MKWSQTLASETGLNLLQTLARLLFALLALLYFLHGDTSQPLPASSCWLLLAVYLLIHIALLRWRAATRRKVANLFDIFCIAVLVVFDPMSTPATLLLFLVFTLSDGILFGLKSFVYLLIAACVATAVALGLHGIQLHVPVSIGSLFVVATMAVCALYFLLLLMRHRQLSLNAEKAAWRNPSSGLITERALISTAGWLVPLHDRLAATLTVVLLTPSADNELDRVIELICGRIRGSDIAGHFGDSLALLLPSTSAGAAESLLHELHAAGAIFHAAVITLADAQQALEPVLNHLETSLKRAGGDGGHWLVHAPMLR